MTHSKLFTLAFLSLLAAQSLAAAVETPINPARLAGMAQAAPATPTAPRQLAPGVMKRVRPDTMADEKHSEHDLIEVLASDPEFAERPGLEGLSPAKRVRFERNIWALDFEAKPVRFVEVDVPQPDGRMQRKLVWYLLYRVANPGDEPVRFVPRFVLATLDTQKAYPDRLIPTALRKIQQREAPGGKVLTTAEIAGEIPPTQGGFDEGLWGVAMWEDVDPSTDYFSVYVQGLTNAYEWSDPEGAFQPGDAPGTGRVFYPKTLALNFWRPGDREYEHEDEIRFIDYEWAFGRLTPKGFVTIQAGSEESAVADQ